MLPMFLVLTSQEGFGDMRVNTESIAAYYAASASDGGSIVLIGHEDTQYLVHETPEQIDAALIALNKAPVPLAVVAPH